jgi:hypothetical protein
MSRSTEEVQPASNNTVDSVGDDLVHGVLEFNVHVDPRLMDHV